MLAQNIVRTLRFIMQHPLNRNQRAKAILRYLAWQFGSRMVSGAISVPFVNDSRLLVSRGMTGATGNIYAGLHEFEDMAFVLHLLRRGDLFIDIGANIGSYTVLAAAGTGASCISFEPAPSTYKALVDNINLNLIHDDVECRNVCLGSRSGQVLFSSHLDTENHVVTDSAALAGGEDYICVPVTTLDEAIGKQSPMLIKIDVEGYETEVIAGAEETLSKQSLHGVMVELNGIGSNYGFDENTIREKLLQHSFRPYSYSPHTRELVESQAPKIHGNTLYLRGLEEVRQRLLSAPAFRVLNHEF